MLAIVAGLVIGKALGILGGAALAVRSGIADKPADYNWRQLAGAAALAGIGFTMSLYIAAKAFPEPDEFAAAKIAVFSRRSWRPAGRALLWRGRSRGNRGRRRTGLSYGHTQVGEDAAARRPA